MVQEKIFLILSSGGPHVQRSGTVCAILVEGIMGEHSCEIILNLDLWFRMGCLKKKFTDDAQGTMD